MESAEASTSTERSGPFLDEMTLLIIMMVATLVVTAALYVFRLMFARRGSLVVLAGPSNAGKTFLYYQLRHGSVHNGTVASMQENVGTCEIIGSAGKPVGSVKVVDVPGHHKLRHRLEEYLRDAKAVVFVVDSIDITPHKVEAAEQLYDVLTNPAVARGKVPVLLACNKMDQEEQAHSVEFIKRTIEKQLDAMRRTKTSLTGDAGGAAAAAAQLLGKTDKPFTLAAVRNPVTFASISALKGQLADVHKFLLSSQ